jgi:magnesium transporter
MKVSLFHKRHPPVGARPGTLVIEPGGQRPDIRVMHYTPASVTEHDHLPVGELAACIRPDSVAWIDIRGLADEPTLRAIADVLALHPLALEDVVNAPQRPKSESYDEHQLVVVRMAMVTDDRVQLEQVAIVIGASYVATFQERDGDVLDPVRQRLRQGRGPIRGAGAGYLGYAIIDTVIDGFYPVLEHVGDMLGDLEEEVVEHPSRATLRRIYAIKRQLLQLRRAVWPHRDVLTSLVRDENSFVSAGDRIYLRDTSDHAMQLLDVLEAYRETVSGLLDVYLSSESNRTNEVMRVLTVMASIFIPLTFVAGVYGMNFEAMPELHSRIGYPIVLGVMFVVGGGLLWKFRRLGWIGRKDTDDE